MRCLATVLRVWPRSPGGPAGVVRPLVTAGVLLARKLLEGFAHLRLIAAAHRQVPQGHHADESLRAAENRQAANLVPLHHLDGVLDSLIFEAVSNIRSHGLADRGRGRIASLRHCPHGDIPVGEHADQLVAVTDWQRTDIQAAHFRGGLLEVASGDHFHARGS